MKIKILLILIICALFSCKKDNEKQIPQDWKQKIEYALNLFEEDQILAQKGTIEAGRNVIDFTIFSSKKSKIIKYVMVSSIENSYKMTEEIYLKDNKVFFSKWSGLSPYLNKKKLDNDSICCAVFSQKTYFKSAKQAVRLKKRIDLKSLDQFDAATEKLNDMPFEEVKLEEAYTEYDRLIRTKEMTGH